MKLSRVKEAVYQISPFPGLSVPFGWKWPFAFFQSHTCDFKCLSCPSILLKNEGVTHVSRVREFDMRMLCVKFQLSISPCLSGIWAGAVLQKTPINAEKAKCDGCRIGGEPCPFLIFEMILDVVWLFIHCPTFISSRLDTL